MQIDRRSFLKLLAYIVITLKFLLRIPSNFSASTLTGLKTKNTLSPFKPRVTRVHSPKATFWDYKTKPYIKFINQDIVDQMLAYGLRTFTRTSSASKAWEKLMPTYRSGNKIAIKPNLNALHLGHEKNITTTPTLLNAVIGSLINNLGISSGSIYVYDLCINAQQIQQILEYPVNCVGKTTDSFLDKSKMRLQIGLNTADSSAHIKMRDPNYDPDGKRLHCFIPKVLTKADHLINIPVFKAHQFILVSSSFKNHFGTVRFSNYNQFPVILHGKALETALVDIYCNKHIKDKTSLIIVDALFGAPLYGHNSNGRLPTLWDTFSGDKTPNSLFFSTDPVAVESVIADFITNERTYNKLDIHSHDYLHQAAKENLGIHEHISADGTYLLIDYDEPEL